MHPKTIEMCIQDMIDNDRLLITDIQRATMCYTTTLVECKPINILGFKIPRRPKLCPYITRSGRNLLTCQCQSTSAEDQEGKPKT